MLMRKTGSRAGDWGQPTLVALDKAGECGDRGQAESPTSSWDCSLLWSESFQLLRETEWPMAIGQRSKVSGGGAEVKSICIEGQETNLHWRIGNQLQEHWQRYFPAEEMVEIKASTSGGRAENHLRLMSSTPSGTWVKAVWQPWEGEGVGRESSAHKIQAHGACQKLPETTAGTRKRELQRAPTRSQAPSIRE